MSAFEVIKHNEDFQNIFSKGHSVNGKYLVVYFLNNNLSISRFGFCVGRRLGTAVKRNKIKRLQRESVRILADFIKPGFDILLVAKSPILNVPLTGIITELKNILTRAKPTLILPGVPNGLP